MLGVHRDRDNGFYGPRRWSFDFDEFLLYLCVTSVVTAMVLFVVVLFKMPTLCHHHTLQR